MFYTFLTVYKFNKKKIKVDYAHLKVREENNRLFSLASNEEIVLPKMQEFKNYSFGHRKENGVYQVCCISPKDDEKTTVAFLKRYFDKIFWYKFGFRKVLAKKVNCII